jgi:hypothetical protein
MGASTLWPRPGGTPLDLPLSEGLGVAVRIERLGLCIGGIPDCVAGQDKCRRYECASICHRYQVSARPKRAMRTKGGYNCYETNTRPNEPANRGNCKEEQQSYGVTVNVPFLPRRVCEPCQRGYCKRNTWRQK